MKPYDAVRHERIAAATSRYWDREGPTFERLCRANEVLDEQWERETPEGQAHARYAAILDEVFIPMAPADALRLAIILKGRNPTVAEEMALILLDGEEE